MIFWARAGNNGNTPNCAQIARYSRSLVFSSGHIICSECQPSLARCPICNIKYRKILTRDFFAEKLLELLERKCRYEIFGCDFSTKVSAHLVEHETSCLSKPPLPVKRKNKKESTSNNEEDGNGGNDDIEEDNEDEDEELNEEEEEDEDVIEVEDIFVSNFAFIVVLLRAYVLEFVNYDIKDSDSFFFEYFLLFLLCAWLYHVWQENGFHVLLDETSPFIAGWFAATVLCMMVIKAMYAPWVGEEEYLFYHQLMSTIKPAMTFATGLFCCIIHAYVYDLR